MPDSKKIDSSGNYLPFPGVTIIAKVVERDRAFWRSVYQMVAGDRRAKDHYASLPFESFHMTTTNLYTVNSAPNGDLVQFIEERRDRFRRMHRALEAAGIKPSIKFQWIIADDRSIKIGLSVDAASAREIRRVATRFGFERKIPRLFHVTLGYCYQNMTRMDRLALMIRMNKGMYSLLKLHGKSQILSQASLCYFEDMTAYTPWDASTNPFETPPSDDEYFSCYEQFDESEESEEVAETYSHDVLAGTNSVTSSPSSSVATNQSLSREAFYSVRRGQAKRARVLDVSAEALFDEKADRAQSRSTL